MEEIKKRRLRVNVPSCYPLIAISAPSFSLPAGNSGPYIRSSSETGNALSSQLYKKKISHHGNQLLGSKTERRKPLAMWPRDVCHETFRCRDKGKREWPTRARKRKTHYVTYLNNPFLSLKKKQTCRLPPTCTESALKRTRELRLQHRKLPEYLLSLWKPSKYNKNEIETFLSHHMSFKKKQFHNDSSPTLTWRDIQHLTVLTSKRNSLFDAKRRFQWTMNGVGLEFNHLFGFGVLDAGSMVSMAKAWRSVPARFHCQGGSMMQPRYCILLGSCTNIKHSLQSFAIAGRFQTMAHWFWRWTRAHAKELKRKSTTLNTCKPSLAWILLVEAKLKCSWLHRWEQGESMIAYCLDSTVVTSIPVQNTIVNS